MLIKHTPDVYEKLRVLGTMATDDVLSPDTDTRSVGPPSRRGYQGARESLARVYPAAMPNGRYMSLLRVMFTDFCMMDCAYCPNSHWVPRRRYAFKVEELAHLFMELYQSQTVAGLFLSSGIAGSPDKTMEKVLNVVDMLRNHYHFTGYIHLKVMPGASYEYVEAAHRLGTRLSVNIETPTEEGMIRLSKMKDFQTGILDPIRWIRELTQEKTGGAVGQVTQLVVGAADETDQDIYQRMSQLYKEESLKRVYFQAFRPVRYTPLEEHPATPTARQHRLYQLDWLTRVYQFTPQELESAFDGSGHLPLDMDPKSTIALGQLDRFPVDINRADEQELLRVPGIGPKAAQRISSQRRRHTIDTQRDLQAMGVVLKRALPFIHFPGYRPSSSRQGRLPLFEEPTRKQLIPATTSSSTCSSCSSSCAGCPVSSLKASVSRPTKSVPVPALATA